MIFFAKARKPALTGTRVVALSSYRFLFAGVHTAMGGGGGVGGGNAGVRVVAMVVFGFAVLVGAGVLIFCSRPAPPRNRPSPTAAGNKLN